jgi:hypothetical protein
MKERGITEFFHLAKGLEEEAKSWWRRHLIMPSFTAAQKTS